MRIEAVTIRNYRSLKDVEIHLDDYSVLIGPNGSGKSSVLYALDWFFNGTSLVESDVHGYREGDSLADDVTIEVAVTFVDLTKSDRERLQQYGLSERVEVRRTWYAASRQTKTVGNARQGPGFAAVRADQGIADRRKAYRELCESVTDLPELPGNVSKDAMLRALASWESEPGHAPLLVEVPDSDANQMMGWNGANVLRECVRFLLIPAASSITNEVGASSRGSALSEIVGSFMAEASLRAQTVWSEKHAAAVRELSDDIRASIENATSIQSSRINDRLSSFIPNAVVTLTPKVPELAARLDPSITTDVTVAGFTNDVSRQGHGVQRAVMISMFQVMAPDEELARSSHQAREGEGEEEAERRLSESLDALPAVIVALEEPEIYQHPIRARSFARTLLELSRKSKTQVLLATHSPYFVHPNQFTALRRFSYEGGETKIAAASVASVAALSGRSAESIEKAIESHVPTEFSEGFFADAVVLVEGPTDRVVISAIAEKLGADLDLLGVPVLSVEGKAGLCVARDILAALAVPTYVIADGDYGTSARRDYSSVEGTERDEKRTRAHLSHKSATEKLVAALPVGLSAAVGSLPYSFGSPSVVCESYAIWRDDIEEELDAWASFKAELASVHISLSSRNNKNLLAYRKAVEASSDRDLPKIFRAVVERIQSLTMGEVVHDTDAEYAPA